MASIVVAKESFATEIDGLPFSVRKGETFDGGHRAVELCTDKFRPFEVDHGIEQATAKPGEKRSTRIGRKDKTEAGEPEPVAETPVEQPEAAGKTEKAA